jgi:hypothetical protein
MDVPIALAILLAIGLSLYETSCRAITPISMRQSR